MNKKVFVKGALTTLLLLTLAGCSNGTSQLETDLEQAKQEVESENEKLRTESEKMSADLEAAKSRIKELEDALEAMQETQTVLDEEPGTMDVLPPELSPSELLLGEWFNQEFHENGDSSWTQNLIFNADGTETICQTYYIPKTMATQSPAELKLIDADRSDLFLWNLNGNTLHLDIENEENESVDFTYSAEQQKFTLGNYTFGREMPTGLDQYVERSLYAWDFKAEEARSRRRFLDNWYFDVFVWTFNEDGTGTWDIPKLGNQPAIKYEFTYSVSTSDDSLDTSSYQLVLDWDNPDFNDTWYCFPTFNADGSMDLNPLGDAEIKLTRIFDINNCPFSEQILSNTLDVLEFFMELM